MMNVLNFPHEKNHFALTIHIYHYYIKIDFTNLIFPQIKNFPGQNLQKDQIDYSNRHIVIEVIQLMAIYLFLQLIHFIKLVKIDLIITSIYLSLNYQPDVQYHKYFKIYPLNQKHFINS